jgi:hypothetical protein
VGDAPCHDHEQRQSAFELLNRTELKCLDLASIFQDIKEDLYFPPRSVSVDQFDGLGQRADLKRHQFTRAAASR